MMIISFIFIPNILCTIWITFSVVSIEVGVVGYMSLWEVNLDSISMINLIMCIGFSIDFTAHICYVYMSSRCKQPKDRVREALYSLGLPILQGSLSTILGVSALILAQSYMFLVFFKMVFLVIFFGAMHGLFLLPVMLSLFGPNSCTDVDDTQSDDGMMFQYKDNKDAKSAHPFSITHPRLMSLGPSPNGLYSSKQLMNGPNFKGYGHEQEKDLGIGTSSEESSENSSSKSQRRKAIDDENLKRRYELGWRKSSQAIANMSPCTFQPSLDIYGNKYEDFWNSADNVSPVADRPRYEHNDFGEVSRNVRKKQPGNPYDLDHRNDKKLYYYDYNQKRKPSDESNKSSDQDLPRKYVPSRRNIV